MEIKRENIEISPRDHWIATGEAAFSRAEALKGLSALEQGRDYSKSVGQLVAQYADAIWKLDAAFMRAVVMDCLLPDTIDVITHSNRAANAILEGNSPIAERFERTIDDLVATGINS